MDTEKSRHPWTGPEIIRVCKQRGYIYETSGNRVLIASLVHTGILELREGGRYYLVEEKPEGMFCDRADLHQHHQHQPWTRERLAAVADAGGVINMLDLTKSEANFFVEQQVLELVDGGKYAVIKANLGRAPDAEGYRTCKHGFSFGPLGGCTYCTPLQVSRGTMPKGK